MGQGTGKKDTHGIGALMKKAAGARPHSTSPGMKNGVPTYSNSSLQAGPGSVKNDWDYQGDISQPTGSGKGGVTPASSSSYTDPSQIKTGRIGEDSLKGYSSIGGANTGMNWESHINTGLESKNLKPDWKTDTDAYVKSKRPRGVKDADTEDMPLSKDLTGKRIGSVDLVSMGRQGKTSMDAQLAQGRSKSKAIYNKGVDAMNTGKDALASARSMTTGPGYASNQERRTAIKDARGDIKTGRKERNKANKATVIRSEFGKTRVNNRAANAAAGGGTKAGNLLRDVFGGRKKPSKRQNRI